jgi:hypothetical protein
MRAHDCSFERRAQQLAALPIHFRRPSGIESPGLSATLERAIAQELRTRPRSEWLAANAAAIEAYNRDVETHGAFGDAARTF